MPELAVNITSALHGQSALATSNILGSNIFNIFFILGVAGLISVVPVHRPSAAHDLPLYVLAALAVGICGNEQFIDGLTFNAIVRTDGLLLLMFFTIYLYRTLCGPASPDIHAAHKARPRYHKKSPESEGPQMGLGKAFALVIGGLVALVGGGECIVSGAIGIAKLFNIPQNTIGIMIVGPGTSFPELIATVVAVIKKQTDLGIGNIIGSNLFNVFFILGVTSLIIPLPVPLMLNVAVAVNLLAAVLLLAVGWVGKRAITRPWAIGFLVIYIAYMAAVVLYGHAGT